MLLETYLKSYNLNIRKMHLSTKIPETTLRNINKRCISKWNIEYFDIIARMLNKSRIEIIEELDSLEKSFNLKNKNSDLLGTFELENRRYIGGKNKLSDWISNLILNNTEGDSFFDVFAGTGIISKVMLNNYKEIILNDFLYSNEVIYKAFFGNENIDVDKIYQNMNNFQNIDPKKISPNYFSENFGNKFFSLNDAKLIGRIRDEINLNYNLSDRERAILISSLIYSADKIANTVGHYDAFRKKTHIKDSFKFNLINPINTEGKSIRIFREDANNIVKNIKSDIAFIDPPYNSRQYSRFYHILENLTTWQKPELSGVAMKPKSENMSEYCKVSAPIVFNDLIKNLNCKYIVVTYNNTYLSKSNSSRNKIKHNEIIKILNCVGETKVFDKDYKFFNAGKTNLNNHKEYLFITKVKN